MSSDPLSPCIRICTIDEASKLCTGCWRTLDEIAAWSGWDRFAKQTVLQKLADREQKAAQVGRAAGPGSQA